MTEPKPSTSTATATATGGGRAVLGLLAALFAVLLSVLVALYRAEEFDAAPLPDGYTSLSIAAEKHDGHALRSSERIGDGLLPGPEDLAYDAETGFLYTGCADGWIRRVKVEDIGDAPAATVEDWAHVGGRPLGLALGPDEQLVVAEAYKGLMRVTKDGSVHLLTDEAEGLKFALTDGVDVASDGVIYFTDASHKYNLGEHMLDILEARPHGRLMSFDPSTNRTRVLVRDLYFANGVAMSPDQNYLIFCETLLRRCSRYRIRGEKSGTVEKFIENLPGFPDNIRYDLEGYYWIGLSAGKTWIWDLMLEYPSLRKMKVALDKYVRVPDSVSDSGVLCVSLEGTPVALYTDPGLSLVTGGLKVGRHLYYGSLVRSYISRIDLITRRP